MWRTNGMILILTGSMLFMTFSVSAYELAHIDLGSVDLGGEIGRRIDVTVKNNLLVLDTDSDFLKPFQEKTGNDGFVGLGMLIDAMVRLAYQTEDADLLVRKEHVVEAAIAAQEPDGYLGMMAEEARLRKLWDVHEMAYLVLGFTSDYQFFHQERSLAAAKRLADYLVARLSETPPPGVFDCDLSPEMPITGLADAFLYLSDQSGDTRYRDFCLNVLEVDSWRKPIVKGRWGAIDGHVYAYVDKCLVQLRLDPERKNAALHEMSQGVLDFILKQEGLTISGACGDHECWHDTQAGMSNLGETCASTYMLKFYDELMRQAPDPLYGDLMERTIYNTLFGAQSPDGRYIRYYTPFEAPRVYFKGDTYCCPNNYRRGLADVPGLIAYRGDRRLVVNLYAPCAIETELEGVGAVQLRQETDYPNTGGIRLHVSSANANPFTLSVRIPRWCAKASVKVNGETVSGTPEAGAFSDIHRVWGEGDLVELDLPMEWRFVKGRRTQAGRVAVMRGPQLFGLNPARNEGVPAGKAGIGGVDPRLFTLDVASIEGPMLDESVHPGGMACTVRVWDPGAWYPAEETSRELTLTEFADQGITAAYFHVPNPQDERSVDDEIFFD